MTDDEIIDSMFEVETVSVRTVNRVPPDPAPGREHESRRIISLRRQP